jgi:hypothetical protein
VDSPADPKSPGPNRFVPRPRFEYRPPSLLAEYKYLALAFLLLIIALSVYVIKAPHEPLTITPSPTPVYIESLPAQPAPPQGK